MAYTRMNITLPDSIARKLGKVPNKSAFIARAVVERFAALAEEARRRARIEGYRAAARERDDERDAEADW